MIESKFRDDLSALINRYSKENESQTPDFILARHMARSLEAFELTVAERDLWWDFKPSFKGMVNAE